MANSAVLKDTPFRVGDLVRVHLRVLEGEKERIQIFEGMVIAIRGRDINRTFTVRKLASGNIGVERIFPLASPWISRLTVKKSGRTRRAKLTFVRRQSKKKVAQISQSAATQP